MAMAPSSLTSHQSIADRRRMTDGSPAMVPLGCRTQLLKVVEQVIVPELKEHHRQGQHLGHGRTVDAAALELARLSAAGNIDQATDRIGQFCPEIDTHPTSGVDLLERGARALGDLWTVDECSEVELALGLCGLQLALRRVGLAWHPVTAPLGSVPSVLVTPSPGEPHMLRATLDSELLWLAGWNPGYEFPSTDDALQRLVADTRFDALDISLSPTFRREHWVPRLAETIARARRASRNPRLLVFVGGRLFCDCPDAWQEVAADGCCPTAATLTQQIRHQWHPSDRKSDTPQPAREAGLEVDVEAAPHFEQPDFPQPERGI